MMLLALVGCVALAPPCEEVGEGFFDLDDDGFGAGEPQTACVDRLAPVDGDCDDGDPARYPGAPEVWYDGVLQDCAGRDDDRDGDGVGVSDDCDDEDAEIHPGAEERWYDGVDGDCDGASDYDQDGDGAESDNHGGDDCDDLDPARGPGAEETWYDGVDTDCDGADDYDQDRDGHAGAAAGEDCDDTDPATFPGAAEECDGVDNDCDGPVDEGHDLDEDGTTACGGDCDDADPATGPGAPEACDGRDEDCDGAVDEDYDLDADGWTTCGGDCDDGDPATSPAAAESWYDGVDTDCDGADDYDQDGDGHQAEGWGEDCDDGAAGVHPGAADAWYDGLDADCDGADDYDQDGDGQQAEPWEGDCDDLDADVYTGAADAWYDGVDANCDGADDYDRDGDGYRAEAWGDDCDDGAAGVHPGAADAWYDGVDTDCDGADDYDQDGDGHALEGWGEDCDDTDAAVHPDAPDVLDHADQDCDGRADAAVASEVARAIVAGVSASQHAGEGGVRLAEDLDGDGGDELLVAAPDHGTNSGALWILAGRTLSRSSTVADAWLTLEGSVGDEVGAAEAGVVDWDADGREDLAVGAPGADAVYVTEPGSASSSLYAASSLAYATLSGTAASDFGAGLAAGDLNGDGLDDLVVGASGSAKGAVYLFLGASGATSETTSSADYTVPGADSGDAIGAVLAGGGDTNADGYDDVCVGVPGDDENGLTDSGSAFVVRGASLFVNLGLSIESVAGWKLTGSAAAQAVGTDCRLADVTGSGTDDVIVAASGYSGGGYSGAVAVFAGTVSGSESFTAADRLVRGGGAAAGGGADLDADGVVDLLVGGVGSAWIVSLAVAGTLDLPDDAPGYWTASGSELGATLDAGARDLDGDGVLEVAVADPESAGAVYVLDVYP